MRKDQPKIAKQIKDLKKNVRILSTQLDNRINMVDILLLVCKNRDMDLLIARIEYDRLRLGKPALTINGILR